MGVSDEESHSERQGDQGFARGPRTPVHAKGVGERDRRQRTDAAQDRKRKRADGTLCEEASRAHDLACIIETPLNDETGAYAQELIDTLTALTWSQRDIRDDIPASEQIATRRRIRQLIVLLRGNDIWIYQTSVLRRLPERYDLPLPDEPSTMQFRLTVAFGPPGKYGETTLRVPVDHGQPFVLPAWPAFLERQGASC